MIRDAIILAGGEGTRLRPVTYEIPKPLVPVQGKAILTWQCEWFLRAGVERVTIVIPQKWVKAFERWHQDMMRELATLSIELWVETEPIGTLGALVHHLADRFKEPFFLSNGDELKGLDLKALQNTHQSHPEAGATIALVEVPNPSAYGVAELEGERIIRFHEKPANPPTNLISSGLYVINPATFSLVDTSRRFLMVEKDLFPQLAEKGMLFGCKLSGPWYDCGTLERWEKAILEWPGSLGGQA